MLSIDPRQFQETVSWLSIDPSLFLFQLNELPSKRSNSQSTDNGVFLAVTSPRDFNTDGDLDYTDTSTQVWTQVLPLPPPLFLEEPLRVKEMPFVDEGIMDVGDTDSSINQTLDRTTTSSDLADNDNHTIPPFILQMFRDSENSASNASSNKQASSQLANSGGQNKPNWASGPNSQTRGDMKPKVFLNSGNSGGGGGGGREDLRPPLPKWVGQLKLNNAPPDSSGDGDPGGVQLKPPSLTDSPRRLDSVSPNLSSAEDEGRQVTSQMHLPVDDVDKPSDANPEPSDLSQRNEDEGKLPAGSDSGNETKPQGTHHKHPLSHKQPRAISQKLSKILDPKSHVGFFQAPPPTADPKAAGPAAQEPVKDAGTGPEAAGVVAMAVAKPKPINAAGSSGREIQGGASASAVSSEHLHASSQISTLNLTAWKSVQKDRKRLMRAKCEEHNLKPRRGMYDTKSIVDRHKNFLYCPVEKSASTFLRRFMYALINSSRSREVSSPFDIPIETALRHSYDTLRTLFRKGIKDFVDKSVKLVVVREPFSRLFSAYVDKLLVPNSYYWEQWGTRAISRYRKSPTSQSLLCGHDVTFPEFVKYVIDTLHVSDVHLQPVNTLCSPCEIQFSVIGHVETLQSDFQYLTSVLKISVANFSAETLAADVISDAITDSTFSAFEPYEDLQHCVSKFETCKRLWRKMQLRGIISDKIKLPLKPYEAEKVTASEFVKIIHDARKKSSKDTDSLQLQKFQALHDAYKEVPAEDIMALVKLYYLDFEIFGYDKHPSFLA